MTIDTQEIREQLKEKDIKGWHFNNIEKNVDGYCALRSLEDNRITWINENSIFDYQQFEEKADLIIVSHIKNEQYLKESKHACFFTKDPRTLFFEILEFYIPSEKYTNHIEESAVVKSKNMGNHVSIGHHTYIGEDVKIGNNCIIRNNISIEGRVTIGDYCIIDSGTVLGMAGFGYVKDQNGNNKRVPHYGGITIGHHVEIGANTCIARGCLDDTQIGNYVKIDNLCHIAHNDILKDNVQVIVAGIGGSTTVGENTWVGFHSVVNEGLNIGKNCVIGAGAAVTKDVPDGIVVAGVPAKYIRDSFDENGAFRR